MQIKSRRPHLCEGNHVKESHYELRRLALLLVLTLLVLSVSMSTLASRPQLVIGHYFAPGSFFEAVNIDLMQQFVEEFQALHPEIEVIHEPYQYADLVSGKMVIRLLTGDAPTVWLVPNVYTLAFAEMLHDLTDLVAQSEIVKDEYLDIVVQANQDVNGRIWGFPQGLQIFGLFYHTERFEHHGVSFPTTNWTWDDFADAASRLFRYDAEGKAVYYGATVQAGHPHTGWALFRSFGGKAFDETGTKSTLDSPAMVQAIEFMKEGVELGYYLNSAPAFLRTASMGLDNFTTIVTKQQIGIPFDVVPVPRGEAGRFVPVVANSWVVSRQATPDQLDAAWKWIEYYSSSDVQLRWARTGEAAPANMVALREYADSPNGAVSGLREFLLSITDADWIGVMPFYDEWHQAWTAQVDRGIKGEISPGEAALQANHAAQVVLDRYYSGK